MIDPDNIVDSFDRRLLVLCSEVRDGSIAEAEIEETYQNADGIEMRMLITVRREVRHLRPLSDG